MIITTSSIVFLMLKDRSKPSDKIKRPPSSAKGVSCAMQKQV